MYGIMELTVPSPPHILPDVGAVDRTKDARLLDLESSERCLESINNQPVQHTYVSARLARLC